MSNIKITDIATELTVGNVAIDDLLEIVDISDTTDDPAGSSRKVKSSSLGGAIKLDDLATPDDNTDLNASTTRHGLLLKLSGSSSDVLKGDGTWGAGGGGGSGDLVSPLVNAEVSVTGATTATISKMHVCSGTSADYTVTLPAASGNAGKLIGFRMAPGLTKFVTLDGNVSETIDGTTTRIMWAQESCVLLCDGSNWFKVAGKSRPMTAQMSLSAFQASVANQTVTKCNVNTSDVDNTGRLVDTGNNRINIIRPGNYLLSGSVTYANASTPAPISANAPTAVVYVFNNGSQVVACQISGLNASYPAPFVSTVTARALAANDQIELKGYQDTGVNQGFINGYLGVTEICDW